jgi:hypothetical protein
MCRLPERTRRQALAHPHYCDICGEIADVCTWCGLPPAECDASPECRATNAYTVTTRDRVVLCVSCAEQHDADLAFAEYCAFHEEYC